MIRNHADTPTSTGPRPGASNGGVAPASAAAPARSVDGDDEALTVLVVEDEESLRLVYRLILERLGLRLLEAENGLAAQRLLEDHRGRLDLVVTDVVMPGVGGRQLAEWVRARWPNAGILYLSGLDHVPGGDGEQTDQLLTKPFYTQELVAKITELLEPRGENHRNGRIDTPQAT